MSWLEVGGGLECESEVWRDEVVRPALDPRTVAPALGRDTPWGRSVAMDAPRAGGDAPLQLPGGNLSKAPAAREISYAKVNNPFLFYQSVIIS